MSQIAAEHTGARKVAVPMHVPGSAWLAAMASPSTLDDAYDWLRGLPLVWEALMWIVTLPWTVAYLVYETSWEHWVRVLVVALVVSVHLSASAPRRST